MTDSKVLQFILRAFPSNNFEASVEKIPVCILVRIVISEQSLKVVD